MQKQLKKTLITNGHRIHDKKLLIQVYKKKKTHMQKITMYIYLFLFEQSLLPLNKRTFFFLNFRLSNLIF